MKKIISMMLVPALCLSAATVASAQGAPDWLRPAPMDNTITGPDYRDPVDNEHVTDVAPDDMASGDTTTKGSSTNDTADNGSSNNGTAIGVGAFFGMIAGAGLLGLIIGKILQAVGVQPLF